MLSSWEEQNNWHLIPFKRHLLLTGHLSPVPFHFANIENLHWWVTLRRSVLRFCNWLNQLVRICQHREKQSELTHDPQKWWGFMNQQARLELDAVCCCKARRGLSATEIDTMWQVAAMQLQLRPANSMRFDCDIEEKYILWTETSRH